MAGGYFMDALTISAFFKDMQDKLNLSMVTSGVGLDRKIIQKALHRPGLALAGFLELFTFDRIQVIGNTEMTYLRSLTPDERIASVRQVFQHEIPCVIVTDSNEIFQEMIDVANQMNIAMFRTSHSTTVLVHLLSDYLDDKFAPSMTIHGTLVDVYGTGILITGRSGIGKSEIALDLVERGHRLVADDVVILTKKAEGILVGSGPDMLKHFMEIRGVGIIDVRNVFGVRAIRLQKRVEVQVELVDWDNRENYERLGLDEEIRDLLDVNIPYLQLPIFPGKNITVIAEVIALNIHLKVYGYHPAKVFDERLKDALQQKGDIADYLHRDFE
jgi:HPr kinase/phosphorylase